MDLLQKQITHNTFGNGVIVEMTSGIITARFTEEIGQKRFPYPEAFEHFLVMDDLNMKAAVAHDLEIKLKKNEEERLLKKKQKQEAAQQRAKELAEEKAASKKKPVAKKPTRSKKTVIKAIPAASKNE